MAQSGFRRRSALLVLAAFLPLAAFGGFAFLAAVRANDAADELRMRGTARAVAAAMDAELGRFVAVVRSVAHGPMLDEPGDLRRFRANARAIAEEFGGFFVLVGPPPDLALQGTTLAEARPGVVGFADPDLRQAVGVPLAEVFTRGEPRVSDPFVGPLLGRRVIWAIAPVRREGRVTRALALAFEPAAFQPLLERQALPPGGFAAIVDAQERIVATAAPAGADLVGRPVPAESVRARAGRASGTYEAPSLRGEPTVYAFERLQAAPGWTVVVATPQAAQDASARSVIGWTLAGALSLLLGLLGIGWLGWRQALLAARQEAAALRSGRAEIERLLGGLPAVIFLRQVRPDGSSRLLYRDGDAAAVLGWPVDLSDAELAAMFAPGGPTLEEFLRRVVAEGSAIADWQLRQPEGSLRFIRTRAQRLSRAPDGSCEVVGYTLNVQAERAAAARAAASSRLAALGEMAGGLAHELKQPLAVISLAAENAARALAAGRQAGVSGRLERIGQQAARAGELIEHLRRFARGAETGEPLRPVPLRHALEGALVLVGGSLKEHGVTVEDALGPPPGPVAMAQLVPLEQVLTNLLANARDALVGRAAAGPRRIRIAAWADPARGLLTVTVEDNAGGIPAAVLARLFEPFVTTKDAEQGTGLGLSICHGLVRGMGGTIEARNGEAGAVFTITLGAAPAGADGSLASLPGPPQRTAG